MANIKEKKGQKVASSKDYANLNEKIRSGKSTFSLVQRKTKEELAKEIDAKKEKKETTAKQQENIQKFWKVLFLNLKDALENSKTANSYLFEIIKELIEPNKAYKWLYKIDVIKKMKKVLYVE